MPRPPSRIAGAGTFLCSRLKMFFGDPSEKAASSMRSTRGRVGRSRGRGDGQEFVWRAVVGGGRTQLGGSVPVGCCDLDIEPVFDIQELG